MREENHQEMMVKRKKKGDGSSRAGRVLSVLVLVSLLVATLLFAGCGGKSATSIGVSPGGSQTQGEFLGPPDLIEAILTQGPEPGVGKQQ